jgi:hypothetical protein
MNNYQCHITINNRSAEHLRLLKSEIPWGLFREGPLADIAPHAEMTAFVATGSTGLAGTEGTVVYQLGDDANTTVSVYFNIPSRPGSSNTVTVDSSDVDVAAQLTGFNGGGATEVCTVKVIDGRAGG